MPLPSSTKSNNMHEPTRKRKLNTAFIDTFSNAVAGTSLSTAVAARPVGTRILPGANHHTQLFLVHLMAVVNTAAGTKHCVATTRANQPCTTEIAWQDALKAVRAVNFFSGDHFLLLAGLNQIAHLLACKRSLGTRRSHSLQAAEVVQGWMRDAQDMCKESVVGVTHELLAGQMERRDEARMLPRPMWEIEEREEEGRGEEQEAAPGTAYGSVPGSDSCYSTYKYRRV
ncbi:hypothetical protein B0A50_04700 [Salinomyces thailandicus]|uniref:Uncharacterized protein n=1 Tax=Salinomyces thailandicus TaxID=706561 RepID=A0A4U0TX31_9PEZI|nr:hypothetical protein B0A50_04700 [Salinomyces thailandica]